MDNMTTRRHVRVPTRACELDAGSGVKKGGGAGSPPLP